MSTSNQSEGGQGKVEEYCDDCRAVKQWAAAQPYVNVKLCPRHKSTPQLYAALVYLRRVCAAQDVALIDSALASARGGGKQ